MTEMSGFLEVLAVLVFAASLCADCFAVSICSSVTLRRIDVRSVSVVAIVFGVVQAGLLLLGYAFGDLFVGVAGRFAKWIGALLLTYVGGSMVADALRKGCEVRNLDGMRNVVIGALATSIDAFVAGASLSMGNESWGMMAANSAAVLVMTMLAVAAGMAFGHRLGHRFGKVAEGIGGAVLIILAAGMLF